MPNLLFLRGRLPIDFRPDRLEYNTINECEDMWTQLVERLSHHYDQTELWYHKSNAKKSKQLTEKFTERWVTSLSNQFKPDIIIARGGLLEYQEIFKLYPNAKKIYYGAGIRYKPQKGKWDLVLVDSKEQQRQVPGSQLFIKPAAELFKPARTKKKYDVCFMANATQSEIKQHKLAFKTIINTNITMLHIGLMNQQTEVKNKNITYTGWHRREKLPELISQCKIGLVCSTSYDSCPRVLPEYLACGLPVVALKGMNFWHEKYINEQTGIICEPHQITDSINKLLKTKLDVRRYYDDNLSINKSIEHLLPLVNGN